MRVTIEKKTDQLNYEDFLGGITRVVTIAGVKAGTKEQQYDIALEGDKRVWRPAVTVLKLLVAAWGDDATEWVGRRAMLYGDPTITFGRDRVGGIRVSHLSHIAGTVTANLTETRGKRKIHTVEPLPDAPKPEPVDQLTDRTRRQMFALFNELGINEADQYAGIAHVIGRPIQSRAELTETEGAQVVTRLRVKKAEKDAGAAPVEPGLFEGGEPGE
jgi:hypothetical protein